MDTVDDQRFKARKQPKQARSQVTVDAIFEGTIQVLLSAGLHRLTTIRVAERAGVSVGTLYQYYPHKQALLFAVLKRHFLRMTKALGDAAESVHGSDLPTMVRVIVAAYVQAKTERIEETWAMSAVASELDTRDLVQTYVEDCRITLFEMLKSACDAKFEDLEITSFMLVAALGGPTYQMIQRRDPPAAILALRGQLESLCLGYLQREALTPDSET